MAARTDLYATAEQREYIYHRIREVRAKEGGKEIFVMDFQNDGEFVGGCIAGGRNYCHINPKGDVEPCVFIHYSGANIREKSLLECLKQPLFMAYRDGQPFNDNMLRPCPMLENPELLQKMVHETGAHSTDVEEAEPVEHLCGKCEAYACEWKKTADKLWEEYCESLPNGMKVNICKSVVPIDSATATTTAVVVPAGSYFVAGDYRGGSIDRCR